MKKPDEIKKGLECCTSSPLCHECPYFAETDCNALEQDALTYIKQLEAERDAIEKDFANAAKIMFMEDVSGACEVCMENFTKYRCEVCEFKWRGYMPEAPKEGE